jgi:predicted outer membrane repeat protein
VTFSGNTASQHGGALFVSQSNVELTRAEFESNTATQNGGAIRGAAGSVLTLARSNFWTNSAGAGGGAIHFSGTLDALNCDFERNEALTSGGAILGIGASANATLRNDRFFDNSVEPGGSPSAPYGGGAIALLNGSYADLVNSAVAFNAYNAASTLPEGGGGIYISDSHADVINTILWGNVDSTYTGSEDQQIHMQTGAATATVNYTCVEDWSGVLGGVSNSGDDPLFVSGPTGDLHLLPGSPALDAGDNTAVTWAEDLDGNPRIDGQVDLGVYEGAAGGVGVDIVSVPGVFQLHANVPNPFNPVTTIRYDLPKAARVRLHVYDVAGRLVRTLEDDIHRDAGSVFVRWDGRDDGGWGVAPGVYFYRIEAGDDRAARKLVFLK